MTDIDLKVGERLRAMRLAHGYKLRHVAEIVGASPQAVHSWERGKSSLSVDRLVEYATRFGVSADYILFGERTASDRITDFSALTQRLQGAATAVDEVITALENAGDASKGGQR